MVNIGVAILEIAYSNSRAALLVTDVYIESGHIVCKGKCDQLLENNDIDYLLFISHHYGVYS